MSRCSSSSSSSSSWRRVSHTCRDAVVSQARTSPACRLPTCMFHQQCFVPVCLSAVNTDAIITQFDNSFRFVRKFPGKITKKPGSLLCHSLARLRESGGMSTLVSKIHLWALHIRPIRRLILSPSGSQLQPE